MSEENTSVNLNDIISEQSNTIKTLVSQFTDRLSQSAGSVDAQPSQPIYMTTPSPVDMPQPPNYALYIGIAVVGWFLLKGNIKL